MRKIFITIVFILIVSIVFAHAPSDITLSYNAGTKMLSINVIHMISNTPVTDPLKHYIKDITVSVNGKDLIVENIAFQQSDNGEKCSFLLNVKTNDKVSVKAVCSVSGIKTSEIIIK